MADDFDDLLEPPKKRGRPTNEERQRRLDAQMTDMARQAEIRRSGAGQSRITAEDFQATYVSKNWLSKAFGMEPATVTKRLAGAPAAGKVGHNREVYRLIEVIPFLIKPVMSAEQFVKTLNRADLPPEINNAFWNSQRARIRYKLEAQEAWDTEDVLRFLGETGMELKDALTVSIEEMRQRAKLTDEQAELFEKMLDDMREDIVGRLLRVAEGAETTSMYDKPLFGVSGDIDPGIAPDWMDEGEED